jgi:hypothetical protein
MRPEDLLKVHSVTIEELSAHADKELMPDHEYTQIVRVIISAGVSVLKSMDGSEKEQRKFETEIYRYAKEKWMARCESQIQPDEDKSVEMKRADKAFDHIYKKGRNPKGWPF